MDALSGCTNLRTLALANNKFKSFDAFKPLVGAGIDVYIDMYSDVLCVFFGTSKV